MRYEFWIDRGGTFTDCILLDRETGDQRVTKVLSSDEAPVQGIRELLDLSPSDPVLPCDIVMGTTVATNALLQRRGADVALVITRGFGDLLAIGDQTRPDLFALDFELPSPLYRHVFEVDARLDPRGNRVAFPDGEAFEKLALDLAASGATSVALVIMHAYLDPTTESEFCERLLAAWPKSAPEPSFCLSTESAPKQGLLSRASTTVLDAYITPLLDRYLDRLGKMLPGSRIRLMQSSGGLATKERFRGPEAILSGPAGGIVAAQLIAKQTQSRRLVTLDMGGTSTDVSLIDGEPAMVYEKTVAGVPLHARMLDIHTIAAGGGSECNFNGHALSVGPQSVGADPGPICYGKQPRDALRLSLTDVNVALGRVVPDHFSFPLDTDASKAALRRMAEEVSDATGTATSSEELGRGLLAVATANMVEAIRTVTVQRGIELSSVDLLVFGGAAGQHACAIARSLGISRILVHRMAGVLSALGIGHADESWSGQRDAGREVLTGELRPKLERSFRGLEDDGRLALSTELEINARGRKAPVRVTRTVALRYRGTESTIDVAWDQNLVEVAQQFHDAHRQLFGYERRATEIEAVAARMTIRIIGRTSVDPTRDVAESDEMRAPRRTSRVVLETRVAHDVPVYELDALEGAPRPLAGPALLLDKTGTHVIEEGFQATLRGSLLSIERCASTDQVGPAIADLNRAARTQILATRFSAIAEQMGEALRRSASSTNIRDRLDYSCAVFDPEGKLVANAPHIPVHLGAMSESVRAVLSCHPKMQPGDSYVTNDPALGGSHLPDITVVTPVYDDSDRLVAFVANRGHHADVGGIEPGSMPAFSTRLEEEGVVFSAQKLVASGRLLERELLATLRHGPYPARNPEENVADLRAQLSANQLGILLLSRFSSEIGVDQLEQSMRTVRQLSSDWMRGAIADLPDEPCEFSDALDDGSPVMVKLSKTARGLHVDFSGSSAQSDTNLNAPRAVTVAAVLYALRVLLKRPLPLNQGCLDPIELTIPEPSILAPDPERPVASGNVETAQRIVDVLLGALGLAAASQGTMNNLSFGTDTFGYYETIAGGAGAGPHFAGQNAVHTHMTNTKITDPEVLEQRFPVRLLQFSLRRGSGGNGRQRGGDGAVREILALTDLRLSVVSERRGRAPFGLAGGAPGQPGRNFVDTKPIPGRYSGQLLEGQTVRIETPGGGGYGEPTGD